MKQRVSADGFYCANCGDFVYVGYDNRDFKGVKSAICVECARHCNPKEEEG